jgi:hypothetical protein
MEQKAWLQEDPGLHPAAGQLRVPLHMVSDPAVTDRRNEMTKSRDDYKSYDSRCRDITAASRYAQPSDSATEAGGRVCPIRISGAHTGRDSQALRKAVDVPHYHCRDVLSLDTNRV